MKRQNLRTVSLIVGTFTYLLCGAAIFGYLEADYEGRQKEALELIELIVKRKYNISEDDFEVLTTTVIRSVPFKAGIQWQFPGAFYFATTVVTTIGYGHSTPATTAGRSFCMIYALIGIPLGLVMFQSIGERLNTFVGSALKFAKRCFKARNPEVTQTNLVMVVSVLSTILMTSMAAVFAKYERWDYFDALYYCFITLTTIGFGDYVALQKESALQSKPEYVALSLIFILFGLSVVSSAVNLLVLKFLTLNTEDERRDEQLRYTANLNPILLEGDVITSAGLQSSKQRHDRDLNNPNNKSPCELRRRNHRSGAHNQQYKHQSTFQFHQHGHARKYPANLHYYANQNDISKSSSASARPLNECNSSTGSDASRCTLAPEPQQAAVVPLMVSALWSAPPEVAANRRARHGALSASVSPDCAKGAGRRDQDSQSRSSEQDDEHEFGYPGGYYYGQKEGLRYRDNDDADNYADDYDDDDYDDADYDDDDYDDDYDYDDDDDDDDDYYYDDHDGDGHDNQRAFADLSAHYHDRAQTRALSSGRNKKLNCFHNCRRHHNNGADQLPAHLSGRSPLSPLSDQHRHRHCQQQQQQQQFQAQSASLSLERGRQKCDTNAEEQPGAAGGQLMPLDSSPSGASRAKQDNQLQLASYSASLTPIKSTNNQLCLQPPSPRQTHHNHQHYHHHGNHHRHRRQHHRRRHDQHQASGEGKRAPGIAITVPKKAFATGDRNQQQLQPPARVAPSRSCSWLSVASAGAAPPTCPQCQLEIEIGAHCLPKTRSRHARAGPPALAGSSSHDNAFGNLPTAPLPRRLLGATVSASSHSLAVQRASLPQLRAAVGTTRSQGELVARSADRRQRVLVGSRRPASKRPLPRLVCKCCCQHLECIELALKSSPRSGKQQKRCPTNTVNSPVGEPSKQVAVLPAGDQQKQASEEGVISAQQAQHVPAGIEMRTFSIDTSSSIGTTRNNNDANDGNSLARNDEQMNSNKRADDQRNNPNMDRYA